MAKSHLNVILDNGLSDAQRAQTIEAIKAVSGVFNLAALDPDTQDAEIQRLFIATLTEGANAGAVSNTLKNIPGVAVVEPPPHRRLII
jgi:hypothetical protein